MSTTTAARALDRPVVLGGSPTWAPEGEVRWDRWGGTAPSWDRVRNAGNPNAIVWPVTGEPEERQALDVARTGPWAYNGPKERELAARMAHLTRARFYRPVANGSVALTVAISACMHRDRMLGREAHARPEVVTSSVSFHATPAAAALCGLRPVLVDVERETLVPTVDAIAGAITDATRILLIPAMYAAITPLDELRRLADDRGLWLIVDGAHAPVGGWRGRPFTAYADVATTSYQLGKVLTSGEGGAVYTDDPHLAGIVDMIRNVGAKPSAPWVPAEIRDPVFRVAGYNHRLAEPQAALLLAQLDRYPAQQARREKQYGQLRAALRDSGLPFAPLERSGDRILYKVGLTNGTAVPTAALRLALRRQLTGEVNAPYAPLCCPESGYVPETVPWQLGHLDIRRDQHFATAHAAADRLLMVSHDFFLRRDAAAHLVDALTVVARHEDALVDWATRAH